MDLRMVFVIQYCLVRKTSSSLMSLIAVVSSLHL